MIFLGKKHPLFDSYIKNHCERAVFTDALLHNTHKGHYIPKELIEDGKKYFFHPGLPMFDHRSDLEYIFNFEDQITLYRSIDNGFTQKIDFFKHPETEYLRYVLEEPRCKKIICHVEKMAQALPKLLQSNIIADKVVYKNVGIDVKDNIEIHKEKKEFTILFTNSYQDHEFSFFLRGGSFVAEATLNLIKKHKNVKLIMRAGLSSVNKNFLINALGDNIEIIDKYCSEEEMDQIYRRADIVILPAARIHSHSICQAFSYGLPVIGSNGWGMSEFIQNSENGILLEGFEQVSWHDDNFGCIENYDYLNNMPKPKRRYIIEQIYYYLEYYINNPQALSSLKENCLEICKTKYSLLNWEEWKI